MAQATKTAVNKEKEKTPVKRGPAVKTPGPDNRLAIFKQLRNVLSKYSPPLTPISDFESRYELVSEKDCEFMGRKIRNPYFGAVIIQSSYVGLYLMHVYNVPKNLEKVPAELRKCLNGKACFHIKQLDDELLRQIKKTVKEGVDCYRRIKFI